MAPSFDDVRAAATRIAPFVHRTPVCTSRALDLASGATVWCKVEALQRAGAFKMRGATNAVRMLDDRAARRGVATHSSGNHGAALALAARERGIPAFVVVPRDVSAPKRAAIDAYGAQLIECEPGLASREAMLDDVVARTGSTVVHPYDDDRVIAGAGTAALELLDEVADLDVLLVPVGGGGLASGTSIAAHGVNPAMRVVGAEPAGADDAARSLAAGHVVPQTSPDTIADGLRTSLSERTFSILSTHLHRIVTVPDGATIAAMRFVWERMKLLVEPSAAVAVAPLLAGPGTQFRQEFAGANVGVVLSGGNVDLDRLPW